MLITPSTAAHIHCCTTTPGVATTVPVFPGFPIGGDERHLCPCILPEHPQHYVSSRGLTEGLKTRHLFGYWTHMA